jgi:hypothetical protein
MTTEGEKVGAAFESESDEAASASSDVNEDMVTTTSRQRPAVITPTTPPTSAPNLPWRAARIDMRAWHPPGYEQAQHGAWLPVAMLDRRAGTAIQRKTSGAVPHDELEGSQWSGPRSAGQPLREAIRRRMERVFGFDFSEVRIHEDPEADTLGALAYTRGTDIFFAPGRYDPHSQHGQALLGHELTHVVQQTRGRVAPTALASGVVINDDSSLEREADELGAKAAAAFEPLRQRDTQHSRGIERDVAESAIAGASFSNRPPVSSTARSPVAQMQPKDPQRTAEPPAGTRSIQRGQVLARLLDEWRAAGLLDCPARPVDVAEFPPIAPPRTGSMRASEGGGAVAGVAPALRPTPGPAPSPGPTRPPLRLIPGGGSAPVTAPEPAPAPAIPPIFAGIAVFIIITLWPRETAPPWMDDLSPVTGGPYGSPEEYDWTHRLTPQQRDYLRRLVREREQAPTNTAPAPKPGEATAPNLDSAPVPILDTADNKRDQRVPDVDFYHGTDKQTAEAMSAGLPIVASGHGEFGKGFYTFLAATAAAEAAQIYTRNRNRGFSSWGVVDFRVPAATLADFFAASTIAAFLHGKFSRILVFPDKTTAVKVSHPAELGGIELSLTWTEFVATNARVGKNVAWPYDLIIGPLKGKLRSQKHGVDQWVFGEDGAMVFNSPTVKRKMSSFGDL